MMKQPVFAIALCLALLHQLAEAACNITHPYDYAGDCYQ